MKRFKALGDIYDDVGGDAHFSLVVAHVFRHVVGDT